MEHPYRLICADTDYPLVDRGAEFGTRSLRLLVFRRSSSDRLSVWDLISVEITFAFKTVFQTSCVTRLSHSLVKVVTAMKLSSMVKFIACMSLLACVHVSVVSAEEIAPGKTGAELITFLRANFRPTNALSYNGARQKMFSAIDNVGGKVRCVYTGVEMATTGIPNGNIMNTEHTWPQSKFGERLPMRADLHHLFPSLNRPNGARANNPFDEIDDHQHQAWWRSAMPQSTIPDASQIDEFSESRPAVFEPREDHKGNAARALFYFWVVYGNDGVTPDWIQPQIPVLVAWHTKDPISPTELQRSHSIREAQGNENPFVLDPTLVFRVVDQPVPAAVATATPLVPPTAPTANAIAAPVTASVALAATDVKLRVVGWNMQSDFTPGTQESDPELLKRQIAVKNGVNIWGLCEVLDAGTLRKFEEGAEDGEGSDFISVMGATGGRDRLAVIYDSQLFEQIGLPIELIPETRLSPGLRASLVVHLKGKRTGQEFLFVVNHLKRGGAQNSVRLQQSKNLNQWAKLQTLPIIAVGDWNFDYDVTSGDAGFPNRDRGFDALIKDHVFEWVRPTTIVKSQADDNFNTLLDFVFVANAPLGWTGVSRILEQEGDQPATTVDFSDDKNTTDHRPVDALFRLGSPVNPSPTTRTELTDRIRALEAELATLRDQLEDMGE